MDYEKIFYLAGAIFFILASAVAAVMLTMMLGGPMFD